MQLQSLCDLKTDEAIRERIGRLPRKLEDLYIEIYGKIAKYAAEADRRIAKMALSWLLCAQRTLKSEEFLEILSVTSKGDSSEISVVHVLDVCCNLVVFDSMLDTFRFAHLSVREFLEKQTDYATATVNGLAGKLCLLQLISASPMPAVESFLLKQGMPIEKDTNRQNILHSYTAVYWPVHCHLANNERVNGELAEFLMFFLSNESDPTSPFAVWAKKNWTQHITTSDLRYQFDDCQTFPPSALFVSCSFDFPEVVERRFLRGVSYSTVVNQTGRTALHVAARHGSLAVLSVLINQCDVKITDEVMKEAVRNIKSAKETMTLFLDLGGGDVKITYEVLEVVAGDPINGKEIMTLLDRRGCDIEITDDVVKAAAGNPECGKDIMTLLLNRRSSDIKITDEVVKVAAGNRGCGGDIMTLLLNRRGCDIEITDDVVRAAAGNLECGKDIMTLLLNRRGSDIKITDEVVKAAAGNRGCGGDIMTLLLDQRGSDIEITDDVVKAGAGNSKCGKDIMTLLLDQRGSSIEITNEVVKVVAKNPGCGTELMILLLDRRGTDIEITDEVVQTVAGNYMCGKDIMTLLLDRRGSDIKITDDVVKAVAGNSDCGKDIMMLLLSQHGSDIKITDELVKAVVGNDIFGDEIVVILLKQCRQKLDTRGKLNR